MSESTFPFGATADEPTEQLLGEEPESGGDSRRTLVIGGLLGAVVLAAGGFFLLSGGDEEDDVYALPSRAPQATAPAEAEPAPVTVPAAFTGEIGRNPFKPLYIAPAAAAEPVEEAPSSGDSGGSETPELGTGSGGGAFVPDGGSALPPPSGGTGTAAPAPAPAPAPKESKLVLTRVEGTGDATTATFTVDDKRYAAKIGTTFGPTAQVLLLALSEGPEEGQWTAKIQIGDAEPFDVVTGEPAFIQS